jgi:hypothetical protein
MGLNTSNHLGVYLEINSKKSTFEKFNFCKEKTCTAYNIKSDIKNKFCSICGNKMNPEDVLKNERFLSASEIEVISGLKEGLIQELDQSCYTQYFSYELEIIGVPEYIISDDTYNDVDIESSNIIDAFKNDKKFNYLNSKLKHAFGDNYVVHYGIYTSVY